MARTGLFDIRADEVVEYLMVVQHDGKTILTLDYDGSAEFGEDYSPEKAVRVFWESVAGPGAIPILEKVCAAHGYKIIKDED